jgi:lactoylglutathione lyase
MSDISDDIRRRVAAEHPAGPAGDEALRPTTVRWTHIALPSSDIDRSIAWYETFTPLRLLDRREDPDGQGAWLGHPDGGDKPFILVLVSFVREQGKGPLPIMAPFAHIGIEMPSQAHVEQVAELGREHGCLVWEPQWMPAPIGFICACTDPDGNMVEFSFDQGVYQKAQEVWGS